MAVKAPILHGNYGGAFVDIDDVTAIGISRTELYQDTKMLEAHTPFIKGHGITIPLKMPKIMNDNYFSLTTQVHKYLLGYIKGIDGFGNWTLESDDINFGGEGNKMRQDLRVTGISDDYTLTMGTDFAALPITKWARLYMEQIHSPYTNRSYTKNVTNLEFSQANHSFELMVIICNASYNQVVDVALLQNVVFTEAKFDTLNYSTGEEGVEELQIPIKAKLARASVKQFASATGLLTALRAIWALREGGAIDKTVDLGSINSAVTSAQSATV